MQNTKQDVNVYAPTLDPADYLNYLGNSLTHYNDNRMTLLNYFIIVEVALFAALYMVRKEAPNHYWHYLVIGGIFFISKIALWTDIRTSCQQHECREALRALEEKFMTSREEENMKVATRIKDNNNNPVADFLTILTFLYKSVESLAVSLFVFYTYVTGDDFWLRCRWSIFWGILIVFGLEPFILWVLDRAANCCGKFYLAGAIKCYVRWLRRIKPNEKKTEEEKKGETTQDAAKSAE